MEENVRMPEGFLDKDKLLVDREIENPFAEEHQASAVQMYPYEDTQSKGYIRYMIQEKSLNILDYVSIASK